MAHTQYGRLLIQVGLVLVALSRLKSPAIAQSRADPPSSQSAGSTGSTVSDRDLLKITSEDLSPSQKEAFRRFLQKFPSACGKPHSLLTSLKTDPQCRLTGVAVRWLARLFAQGFLEAEVEDRYLKRFSSNKCVPIDIDGAQVRGDSNAPIALIEFSDFECQHCRSVEPLVKQVLAEFKNVKLVFMNYPQPIHRNAATAAAAALAAGKQGKFWDYHDKLFENADHLQLTKLLLYARELKLDVNRFQLDLEALRSRVAHERQIGDKLALPGTPTFFVGCQKLDESLSIETIRSYIEAEMAK